MINCNSKLLSIFDYDTEKSLLERCRNKHYAKYVDISHDPLISIVIATYNRGEILTKRTIPSILNQTYKNFEIVIVGDHCIDNTPELISHLTDPRIRFYDLPKRGVYPDDPKDRWFVQGAVPRNKGLRIAKGDWLSWISDDDILLPHHFETMLKFAKEGNFEFVSAAYTCEIDGKVITRRATDYDPPIGGMQTWLYRSYLKLFRWNINSWQKDWNRPCDYDLQDRMFSAGVRMGFTSEIVAHVPAVHGTSTIGFQAHKILADKYIAP